MRTILEPFVNSPGQRDTEAPEFQNWLYHNNHDGTLPRKQSKPVSKEVALEWAWQLMIATTMASRICS
jgi:hypothetical protein